MLWELGYKDDIILSFKHRLKSSKINSIDSFLEIEENADFINIGKVHILYALHNYENATQLVRYDNWYRFLWNVLKAKSIKYFKSNKLKVVTYNYDRSLEYYLFNCIKNSYGLDEKDAFKLLSETIEIIHVHGKMGVFNVENHVLNLGISTNFRFDYGDKIEDKAKLEYLSNNIKIIHDNTISESIEIERANEIFSSTQRICFLGFGFAKENLKRLKINTSGKQIFCSAYGLSEAFIKQNLRMNYEYFKTATIEKDNAECESFLTHHFILL